MTSGPGGAHRSIVPYARGAMFTRYRTVLAHPGALRFSLTAFVARLPISMDTLGIVLLVTGSPGSYGLAGALSATLHRRQRLSRGRAGAGARPARPVAGAAPGVHGVRRGDRRPGPDPRARRPGRPRLRLRRPGGRVVPADRLRGPGALVPCARRAPRRGADRLRAGVGGGRGDLHGRPDDGHRPVDRSGSPGLRSGWPWSPVGSGRWRWPCSAAPSRCPTGPGADAGPRPPMPWLPVVALATVAFALGSMFAAAEVSTVAFSAEQGAKPFVGVLLAAWALGSLLAGLVSGTLPWRRSPAERLRIGAIALALVMVPLSFIGSMVGMGIALFVAGFAIAPTLIATKHRDRADGPGHRG